VTADGTPPARLLALLGTRRFWPLCATQAAGAFNDNLIKNALVVLALFRLAHLGPVLVALAGGLFILPYALFSATAGALADRHDKARLIRVMKRAELALMLVAAIGLLAANVTLLLLVLVGLGLQATFFGPLKYGILPDHLAPDELVAGNGLVEGTTFIAILAGTVAGGALVTLPAGRALVAGLGLIVSLIGLATARPIPPAPPRAPDLALRWNILRETWVLLRQAAQDKAVWGPILGISWFWTVGATLLAEFPVVAKVTLGANGEVVTLFLTAFSVGVGIGSLLCARLARGRTTAWLVPIAALGISLFTWDFSRAAIAAHGLATVPAVLAAPAGWRVLADLLLLAACGGLYSVPLYAMVQRHAAAAARARMIAANNVMNALFMVAGAGAAAVLAILGVGAPSILAMTALLNLGAVFWARHLVRGMRERTKSMVVSPGHGLM
jgi:acyl-[acyl-carrier-protein]-phospholipid O-acyltransferase / long-chain-fatty-acid--[acyl-carrier-protein] ligase